MSQVTQFQITGRPAMRWGMDRNPKRSDFYTPVQMMMGTDAKGWLETILNAPKDPMGRYQLPPSALPEEAKSLLLMEFCGPTDAGFSRLFSGDEQDTHIVVHQTVIRLF